MEPLVTHYVQQLANTHSISASDLTAYRSATSILSSKALPLSVHPQSHGKQWKCHHQWVERIQQGHQSHQAQHPSPYAIYHMYETQLIQDIRTNHFVFDVAYGKQGVHDVNHEIWAVHKSPVISDEYIVSSTKQEPSTSTTNTTTSTFVHPSLSCFPPTYTCVDVERHVYQSKPYSPLCYEIVLATYPHEYILNARYRPLGTHTLADSITQQEYKAMNALFSIQ